MQGFEGKSEHFMRNVVRGEELDFDAFKTQEEFERYEKEVKDFLKETDSKQK